MTERIDFDPAMCSLNQRMQQELKMSPCHGECMIEEGGCVFEAFDGLPIRQFKEEYRIPPEKDILTQIADVQITLFDRKGKPKSRKR